MRIYSKYLSTLIEAAYGEHKDVSYVELHNSISTSALTTVSKPILRKLLTRLIHVDCTSLDNPIKKVIRDIEAKVIL